MRFDTSNYYENNKRPLSIGENKKALGFLKDEEARKITREVVALRPETWSYLMDDGSKHKKAKGTKKCITIHCLRHEDYKDCLFNNTVILRLQERFKSDYHNMYTEKVNKVRLSSNDDKRLQTFDRITTYPHGTNDFKVSEDEMMIAKEAFVTKYEHCSSYGEIVSKRQRKVFFQRLND